MAKGVIAGCLLLAAGSTLLGHNEGFEQTARNVEFYSQQGHENNTYEIDPPDVSVYEFKALAVAKITGTLPINGRYHDNRPGFVDCDYTLKTTFPYEAEVVMHLGNIAVTPGQVEADGTYNVTATLSRDYELFNPGITLADATIDPDTDPGLCDKDSFAPFMNSIWRTAYAAVPTVADCLVSGLSDSNEAAEVRRIYDEGLKKDIKALNPNIDNVTFDFTGAETVETPYEANLMSVVEDIKAADNVAQLDVSAVTSCTFEDLDIVTGINP